MFEESDENGDLPELIRRILNQSADSLAGTPVIANILIAIPPAGQPGASKVVELEIHTIGDEVKCVGEFPGVNPRSARALLSRGRIVVVARDGERTFQAEAEVPPPDPSTISVSLKHGVLEIGYRRLFEPDRAESH